MSIKIIITGVEFCLVTSPVCNQTTEVIGFGVINYYLSGKNLSIRVSGIVWIGISIEANIGLCLIRNGSLLKDI